MVGPGTALSGMATHGGLDLGRRRARRGSENYGKKIRSSPIFLLPTRLVVEKIFFLLVLRKGIKAEDSYYIRRRLRLFLVVRILLRR
jgi:hypothetical protein